MRRLAILTVLVAVAAGCGGSGKRQTTNPLQLSKLPSSPTCAKKGISTRAARAGTCLAGGTKVIVANGGHPLQMKDYAVRVTGIRTSGRLGSRAAQNFTPSGRFVIVTLRVQNTGTSPQQFDGTSKLAYLLVDGAEYAEVSAAEDQLGSSFRKVGSPIKPGRTASGSVVFDPPADHAKNAGAAKSYVVFLNTEDSGNGYPRVGFRAIGFARLSK